MNKKWFKIIGHIILLILFIWSISYFFSIHYATYGWIMVLATLYIIIKIVRIFLKEE
ncbi:MAG: hypothetical protein NTX05_04390 [Fusobacteria bacterium]|nr:hypothetical protein [Fusobacteriota bacterium]